MSLIWTESFAGFERHEGGNDNNVTLRLMEALQVAGYKATRVSTSSFLSVVPDPVVPSRAALRFNGTVNSSMINCAIGYDLGSAATSAIIFGFSLFIPADFAPGNTQPSLVVGVHPSGASDWASLHNTPAREAFRVRSDLAICIGSSAPQSNFKPTPGRMAYFEVKVDQGTVSVWMDDILVHQSSLGTTLFGMISIGFTSALPIPNNWAIGNLYILVADTNSPNVRLGPSTRVIGKRPTSDVRADFSRPVEAESNAEVVAQDIVPNPEMALQTTEVGATDIYNLEADTDTAGAALVHAVAVKSVAANLEAIPHTFTPLIISDGVESEEGVGFALQKLEPFTDSNLHVVSEHPTKGIIITGANGEVWHSADDGDTWVKLRGEPGGPTWFRGGFSPNGNALLMTTSGDLLYCHDSSPIDEWGSQALGTGGVNNMAANGDVWAVTGGSAQRKVTYPKDGPITIATFPTDGKTATIARPKDGTTSTWLVITTESGTIGGARLSTNNLSSTSYRANVNVGSNSRSLACMGTRWLLAGSGSTTVMQSTNDGSSWSAAQNLPLTLAGVDTIRALPEISRFIAFGTDGRFALSPNGSGWQVNQLEGSEGVSLQSAIITKTGRLIMVGTGGTVAMTKPLSREKPLPVLGGYQLHYNVASLDPATGDPWTPGAAAIAQIGMRVES